MVSCAWIGPLRRVLWPLPLLIALLLLAACDEAETQPEPAAPTTAVTQPAPQPTAAPSAPTTTGPSAGPEGTLYKGVAQGLTAEGFPFLGAAEAPVTLTDHSDFL